MSEDRAWMCADCDAEPDCTPVVLYRRDPVTQMQTRITLCNTCWWRSPESAEENGAEVEPEEDHE